MANASFEAAKHLEALKGIKIVNKDGLNFINNFFDGRWTRELLNIYSEMAMG